MDTSYGEISPVFYTLDRKLAFQKAGAYFNLYGEDGAFVKEFRSFISMCAFMSRKGE